MRFATFLKTFERLSKLSDEEVLLWRSRLDRLIGVSGGASRSHAVPTAQELKRVVPGPPKRAGGLRVTSLEIYGDCTMLRWHLLVVEADRARKDRIDVLAGEEPVAVELSLTDSKGYVYDRLPGPYDGPVPSQDLSIVLGVSTFVPSLPDEVSWISVQFESFDFFVELG